MMMCVFFGGGVSCWLSRTKGTSAARPGFFLLRAKLDAATRRTCGGVNVRGPFQEQRTPSALVGTHETSYGALACAVLTGTASEHTGPAAPPVIITAHK